MERLTKKTVGCFKYDLKDYEHKVGEFTNYECFYAYVFAVGKLGAYEDTELTPQEIKSLQAENAELNAKLDNSVQLPCRIGDTVYWLYAKGATGWFNDIRESKVNKISITSNFIEIHSERTSLNDTNFWGILGKNVFLTKPEAEARLKEILEIENER